MLRAERVCQQALPRQQQQGRVVVGADIGAGRGFLHAHGHDAHFVAAAYRQVKFI